MQPVSPPLAEETEQLNAKLVAEELHHHLHHLQSCAHLHHQLTLLLKMIVIV